MNTKMNSAHTMKKRAKITTANVAAIRIFTQEDPRNRDKGLTDYNVLLFQLDSSFDEDGEEIVMIGDMGVMNFFIRQDDLQRRDFSDILYFWDCC